MKHKISIIVDDIRYDAVKRQKDDDFCELCDLADFCDGTCYSMPDWCRMIEGDDRIYFKKIEEEL